MDDALQPVLRLLYVTAAVIVGAGIFGAVCAFVFGGSDRRKRKAIFSVASGAVLVAYGLWGIPRLLGV